MAAFQKVAQLASNCQIWQHCYYQQMKWKVLAQSLRQDQIKKGKGHLSCPRLDGTLDRITVPETVHFKYFNEVSPTLGLTLKLGCFTN